MLLTGRSLHFLLVPAACVSLSAACSGGAPPEAYSRQVTDPDGVRAVENGSLPVEWPGSLPRLVLEEVARIGSTEGPDEQLLSSRWSPYAVDPDGRVAYLDQRPSEMRVYDPDGRFLFRAGRSGDGPGEFRIGFVVEAVPGLGWMVAGSPNRLVLFDGDGRLLETIPAQALPGRILNRMGSRADGTLWYFADEPVRFGVSRSRLMLADWKHMTADTVATIPRTEIEVRSDYGLETYYPQSLAIGPGGRAWTSTAFDYVIEIYGRSPGDRLRLRRDFDPVPDPDYGKGKDESMWTGSVMEYKRIYALARRFRPAIESLQWVDDRELWIFTSVPADSTRSQVDVFSPEGCYLRAFSVDNRFQRAKLAAGHAWLLTTDEEEVPVLIRYRYRLESP
jgi:hypothetical protein